MNLKGYMCSECHGITGKKCKICKGQGWIDEVEWTHRQYQAKYGLWGRIKRLLGNK